MIQFTVLSLSTKKVITCGGKTYRFRVNGGEVITDTTRGDVLRKFTVTCNDRTLGSDLTAILNKSSGNVWRLDDDARKEIDKGCRNLGILSNVVLFFIEDLLNQHVDTKSLSNKAS